MNLRGIHKTTILLVSLVESLARFALLRAGVLLLQGRAPSRQARASWLHGCCRRISRRLGIRLTANGTLPSRGLIVSNHLSHLDILIYASLGPVVFVAKEEVRKWPLLGRLAACGGTVFVDRERPGQAGLAAQQIQICLRGEIPVLLFPEGTSSEGSSVLPFRSTLFEPAMRAGSAITAAAVGYSADDADEESLAYYGDKVFFPHLCATLGRSELASTVAFNAGCRFDNRKEAARITRAWIADQRLAMQTAQRSRTASRETALGLAYIYPECVRTNADAGR